MLEKNVYYLPLTGRADAIDDLRRILSGVGAEILETPARLLLTSPALKHARSSEEALRIGTELMTVVGRVYRTLRGHELDAVLQNTTYIEQAASKVLEYRSQAEALTVGARILGGSLVEVGDETADEVAVSPAVDPLTDVQDLVAKVLRHPEVERALGYLRAGDYVSLYKLYEVIKGDVGKDDDLTEPPRQYIDRGVLRRIRHNLNSPVLSGESARHAVPPSGQANPSDRMEAGEIANHLRTLFLRWAADKP